MNLIRIDSINNHLFLELSNSLSRFLKITNIQTYYPILSLFHNIDNTDNTYNIDNDEHIIFDHTFQLLKLEKQINLSMDDSYIKHFFEAQILNKSNKNIEQKNMFIKILPFG